MQDMTDDDRKTALGEILFDELRAIREGIANLPTRTEFNELKEQVQSIDARTDIMQFAITDISKTLKQQGRDIANLKAARV